MYAGRIVEHAPVHEIYADPAHPYTQGLIASIPRVDSKGQQLAAIKGLPPNLLRIPPGCPFHPRCPYARDNCKDVVPPDFVVGPDHTSACLYWEEVRGGSFFGAIQ
jgi:oligopeptide transport system ATP-binding protein